MSVSTENDPVRCGISRKTNELRRMSTWLFGLLIVAHIVLLTVFAIVNIKPMVIMDVCGLLCYSVLVALLTSSNLSLRTANIASLAEILVHTVCGIVCIGWGTGFSLYCIALVGVVFFWSRAAEKYTCRLNHPLLISITLAIVYFLLRLYCNVNRPFYALSPSWINFFFMFNSALTFVAVTSFAKIYSTAIENIERAYRQESNIDELTRLYNRRKAREILGDAHQTAETCGIPYTVAMIDIDSFKQINDTWGHNVGDYALSTLAQMIVCHTSSNAKPCRWGGDEFLIVGTPTKADAMAILESLREDVAQTEFRYGGVSFNMSITIGVAIYKENSTISEVIARADAALYRAKSAGKDKVLW